MAGWGFEVIDKHRLRPAASEAIAWGLAFM